MNLCFSPCSQFEFGKFFHLECSKKKRRVNARSNKIQRGPEQDALNELCFHVDFAWYGTEISCTGQFLGSVRQSKFNPLAQSSQVAEITSDYN